MIDFPSPMDDGEKHRRDAERKRNELNARKEVDIAACEDPIRRAALEIDDIAWLRFYFGSHCIDPFWYDFTGQQRDMIEAIRHAIVFGGDQAIAASRGEGKTTLFERLLTKYTLSGVIAFSVLFAATGSAATDSLDAIKTSLEESDLLYADYPEVCTPVRALEGAPQRAGSMIVTGKRHDNGEPYVMARCKFSWCGQEIVFPRVPGSPSAGAIIATRGLDSAVRGLKKKGRRPQVAGIDDPDTEDTARSEDQAKKLEDRIDRAISGLGGQQRGIARVMLTTLQNRTCVSYRFTDPTSKPTWKGKRFRFLIEKPDRLDLWDEYVQLRSGDMQTGDQHARRAHAFYVERRNVMDAGSVVANPNRFDGAELPDGSQLEISAIQRYFNEVARIGQDAVSTEYDNDPPEESGPMDSGLTAYRIQRQLSGYDRRIVPPGCTLVTQGIDVRKIALHFVVRAWQPTATGYTIDYGVQEVRGTTRGSDDGLEQAIYRALEERRQSLADNPYVDLDGKPVPVALTLVDAGWQTPTIYQWCRQTSGEYLPSMGFGKSNGSVRTNFNMPGNDNRHKQSGDNWFRSYRQKDRVWLVCASSDFWKNWEHARWLTTAGSPGAMYLYGTPSPGDRLSDNEKSHFSYAKHLTAEMEVEEVIKGILTRRFKSKSDTNHYFDSSYLADVAASMKGIRLIQTAVKASKPDERPSLADLRGRR